jgi:predicted phosphodiesterase
MRIGIISDVHGNYVALRAVLEHMGSVDALWCLGDLVGYGPQPEECVQAISSVPHLCIAGNHDWGMLGRLDRDDFNSEAREVLEWTRDVISPRCLEYIEALPVRLQAPEVNISFVHGSPRDPMWEYLLDLFDAAECFPLFSSRYLFVGHTHVPLIFRELGGTVKASIIESREVIKLNVTPGEAAESPDEVRMIINPGSVGQPRDGDPRASYMVLDIPEQDSSDDCAGSLTLVRIGYKVEETQALMTDLGFPPRLIARLARGL